MSTLVTVLKDEIRRLARKEVRAEIKVTKRTTVQHRHDIAKLKRLVTAYQKQLGQLASQISHHGANSEPAEEAGQPNRFSSRSVRAQRKRLRLSAAEYGKLIGVSGQTVYQWEQGRSRPRRAQFAALIAARTMGRREAQARLMEKPAGKAKRPSRRRKLRRRAK